MTRSWSEYRSDALCGTALTQGNMTPGKMQMATPLFRISRTIHLPREASSSHFSVARSLLLSCSLPRPRVPSFRFPPRPQRTENLRRRRKRRWWRKVRGRLAPSRPIRHSASSSVSSPATTCASEFPRPESGAMAKVIIPPVPLPQPHSEHRPSFPSTAKPPKDLHP